MAGYPEGIERLLHEFQRLPGVGRRAAERIVTHLMDAPEGRARALAEAVGGLRASVVPCPRCGMWSDGGECGICRDARRDSTRICVVERPADVHAFEQSGAWSGLYHVLGGVLSPLRGVGPDELSLDALERRVREETPREIIVATSPTVEGDATAHYVARILESLGVTVARIGLGIPLGAGIGYADAGTLRLALEGRRALTRSDP